ncbi:MAG: FAD-dependent oxidoreductase [Firmicutes bacterium]|nr:FAD-dependent oxidoreductase [Bacillota bacterium]
MSQSPAGGQVMTTAELENYPGFGRGSSGPQVISALTAHAREMGAELVFDQVQRVELADGRHALHGEKSTYQGRTMILAPGAEPRQLQVPGEKEFWGRGVSYCATCDAELYEGREVVVVGSGDAAVEEALYLTRFATRVSIAVVHEEGRVDANPSAFEKALGNKKIEWLWNSRVVEIVGEGSVSGVKLKNLRNGEEYRHQTDGVFVFIGITPHTDILRGMIELDRAGYIITDERMQTSRPGVFAAGDARAKYLRQVVTAVADGAIAAVAAEQYLEEWGWFTDEVQKAESPVLVGYYSPQEPESLDAMQQADLWTRREGRRIKLVRVDATRNHLMTERFKVSEVPSFLLFNQGEMVTSMRGGLDPDKLQRELH